VHLFLLDEEGVALGEDLLHVDNVRLLLHVQQRLLVELQLFGQRGLLDDGGADDSGCPNFASLLVTGVEDRPETVLLHWLLHQRIGSCIFGRHQSYFSYL
jgi:hypothetical protein